MQMNISHANEAFVNWNEGCHMPPPRTLCAPFFLFADFGWQSKIISSADTMFAIVDAGNWRHGSHCPLEDVSRNIHNNAETGRRYEG